MLTEVPQNMMKLTNLTDLVLSENKIPVFPAVVLSLSIKRLGLGHNMLGGLPEDCDGTEPLFQTTEQLDLSHNLFAAMPFRFLTHFKVLEKLDMQYNPLGKTQVIEEKVDSSSTTTTTTTTTTTSDVSEKELGLPASLVELILSNCDLVAVPRYVYRCPNIRKLTMCNNELSHFEQPLCELAKMTTLQVLEMNCNRFSHLPDELCSLTSLTRLSVEDNLVGELPEEIGAITSLEEFNFMGNRLKELPSSFTKLASLNRIDVMYNRLGDISSVISALPQEKILYFAAAGNSFEEVPPEVAAKCTNCIVKDPDPPVELVKNVLYLGSYRTSKSFFALQRCNIHQVLVVAHNIKPPYPDVCFIRYDRSCMYICSLIVC